jgi:hypothetical protein
VVTNRSAAATYTIKIRVAGAASAVKQQIASAIALAANATDIFTIGATLGVGDVITVQASTTTVSFNAFGQENT